MNWIILEPHEQSSTINEYVLDLKKSIHIIEILKKTRLDIIKALVPNKGTGKFQILEIMKNSVSGVFTLENKYLSKKNIEDVNHTISLIIPLPRPQTGKKILHLVGAFGIQKVIFLLPESKNSQYLTSPVYKSNGIWQEIRTGMEQTGSFIVPIVTIDSKSRERINEKKQIDMVSSINIAFDPLSTESWIENFMKYYEGNTPSVGNVAVSQNNIKNINLFFGSESGFRERDLEIFRETNTQIYNLGETILRSEYAVSAVLFTLQGKRR